MKLINFEKMELKNLNNYVQFFSFILKYSNSDVFQTASANALNEVEKEETQNTDEYNQKPEELVEDLKKMGPTYVKLGQLLSTRPDLLPENYLAALANLQDDVETIPFEDVQKIFEEEIGTRINKAFELFGGSFFTDYHENEIDKVEMEYFPRGIIEIEEIKE